MKSLRERFEEEYAAVSVPADNKDGFRIEYVYYAPWYVWDLPGRELSVRKKRIVGLFLLGLVLFLMAACAFSRLNSYPPVVLFTVLALCSFVMELSGILPFALSKERTTQMTYRTVSRILGIAPVVRAICLVPVLGLGLFYIYKNGFETVDLLALLGYASCLSAAVILYTEFRKIPVRTEKNKEMTGTRQFL